jgi:hypothetical protein
MEANAEQHDLVITGYSMGESGMRVRLLMGDCEFYYPRLCPHQENRERLQNQLDDLLRKNDPATHREDVQRYKAIEQEFDDLFNSDGWDIHGADRLGSLRSVAAHDNSKAATASEARLTREKVAESVRAKREEAKPPMPAPAQQPVVADYSIPELQRVQRDPKAKVVFTEKPKSVRKPKILFPKAKATKPAEPPQAATTPAAPTNSYQPMNPRKLAAAVQQIRSSSSDLRRDTSI